jgi:hypothetical protein
MTYGRNFRVLAGALGLAVLAQGAFALETVRLRRGVVVPVRFEQQLTLKDNRVGDRFSARVENDRDLPDGTRLLGTVRQLERERDGRQGFMELEFELLELPDGSRYDIRAVPIRIDDKSVRRGSDGRFTAKKKLEDSGKHILGGMVGGYLIGRILGDKHAEGIILGALAGVLVAETQRAEGNREIVVKKDAKLGALFERDTVVQIDGRYPTDDRYRTDPYRRGDPYRRDDPYRSDPWGRPDERDPRPLPRDDRYDDPRYAEPIFAFRGRELRFEGRERPYREGDVWMVPLEATARQVGLSVDGNADSRRIYVEDDETVLVFEQGSREYRLNGRKAVLPQEIAIRGETIFVPIDAISDAKNRQITKNGTPIRN